MKTLIVALFALSILVPACAGRQNPKCTQQLARQPLLDTDSDFVKRCKGSVQSLRRKGSR